MSEKWVVMSPDTVTSDLGSKNTCLVNLELSTTFLLPHMLKDGISGLMQFQAHSVGNRGIYKKINALVMQRNAMATSAVP